MIVAVGARYGKLEVIRGIAEGRVLCRCDCGCVAGRALAELDETSACRVCLRERLDRLAGRRVVRRNTRRTEAPRARTISVQRLTKREIERGRTLYPEPVNRPKRRSECVDGPRPCPHVGCRYHLYLDVDPRNGSIKINWPDVELEEMPATCALDVADEGGLTLEEVAIHLNLTRERVRQVIDDIAARIAPAMGEWA